MKLNARFRTTYTALAVLAATVVPQAHAISLLDGFGGNRNYGTEALLPNDDSSSGLLSLPFNINFFGNSYNNFYVNNNGNITFNSPLGSYTPNPFPVSNQPMIAPWWADVDTRGFSADGSNNVWVHSPNSSTLVVTWDKVGYYASQTDKRNDFQLVLRDRSDTGAGNFDVDFRYNQLQWTTGAASGGTNGLGGTPAQAGYDAGNGTNFYALPGSRTNDVLDLQNTSNVSTETPGLWTFAVRNGNLPGSSPSNPYMPVVTEEGWNFFFNVTEGQRVFVDPEVAVGYDFTVNSGPSFASVLLPNVGDGLFNVLTWNGTEWVDTVTNLAAGSEFSFLALSSTGVDRFRITGIETEAALDPTNTSAFVTGLTFAGAGAVNMTQTPITVTTPVPEPETYLLMGMGLVGVLARRRQVQAAS